MVKNNIRIENAVSPPRDTVTHWLEVGFSHYPNSIALQWNENNMSYYQLYVLSNRLANYLAAYGVKKGDRVGICLNRSSEMIAAIIGILKTGAAYVPLDPNYPVERLQMMCEDASLTLLISHNEFAEKFSKVERQLMVWEKNYSIIERYSDDFSPGVQATGDDVAYIIFTSGSTGRPKGIAMPHRALANLIGWQLERPYFLYERNVLQYSSISFDVSFQEIATTLASGGTLTLVTDEERRDPRLMMKIMHEQSIERVFMPFVALRSLVSVAIHNRKYPSSLCEVITAGEQLRVDDDLRLFFSEISGAILENQYGPSESHVITAYLLPDEPERWPDLPPIGAPLVNNNIYILDEEMKPVPPGETGELYLAGINLAHGYVGRPDLTRAAFVDSPFSESPYDRLYKTGDLGFYNSEGNIKFLGRADHQIKIRGYRIEPGEINTAGAKFPGIAQCLTHAMRDAEDKLQLVTYYKSEKGANVTPAVFKAHLAETLPVYMIPAFVLQLNKIPYTPSGKVDFKALPSPFRGGSAVKCKERFIFRNDTETKLAKIWRSVLSVDTVSRTDDFFEIGGDSLKAVSLFMEIEEQFNRYLPLSTLVHAPTIEALAQVILENKEVENKSAYRSLQTIQVGSRAITPLFLVHGGAGNVLMFKDLAEGLPSEQPIYAFQWSGWDGHAGEEDIGAMAEYYKNELRDIYPEGPYYLGGHCIGGIIAIEMAKLLQAEGEDVRGPLLVSDAPNLHSSLYHANDPDISGEDNDRYGRTLQHLNNEIAAFKKRYEKELVNDVSKSDNVTAGPSVRKYPLLAKVLPFYVPLAKKLLKGRQLVRLFKIRARVLVGARIAVKDRELFSSNAQLKAIKKHHKSTYTGDVLYFKSEEFLGRKLGLYGWWEDIYFGFRELCTGRFEGYAVGGRHNDVLKKKCVHKIIRARMLGLDD